MTNSTIKQSRALWIVSSMVIVLALALLPTILMARGGDGDSGGSSGGLFGIDWGSLGTTEVTSQQYNNGLVSVTVSNNPNFGTGRQYSGTATYSPTRSAQNGYDTYVSQPNDETGEGNNYAGGDAIYVDNSVGSGYVIGQACVNPSQVDVRFQPPVGTLGPSALYGRDINDQLGVFNRGQQQTLRLAAGANYPRAFWSYAYQYDNHTLYGTDYFSFSVRNDCDTVPLPPPCIGDCSDIPDPPPPPPPPPPPSVDLVANPAVVDYNNPSNLTWTSNNTVGSCSASGGWSGAQALNDQSGVSTGPLTAATTFVITCQGQSGTTPARDQETVGIRVGTGATIITDHFIVRRNERVELKWNVGTSLPGNCFVKAGTVTIDGPLTTTSGVTYYNVIGETEFSISCDGDLNKDSVTIKVLPEFQET